MPIGTAVHSRVDDGCAYNRRNIVHPTMKITNPIWLYVITMLLSGWTHAALAGAPVIFFSDLDSAPNSGGENDKGAFVTVWGRNFRPDQGENYVTIGGARADNYRIWSDTKITFQIGPDAASGEIVAVVGGASSNGIPFRIRPGRIFFISAHNKGSGSGSFDNPWRSPRAFYERIRPGDIAYFRAGTYSENYGGNWGERNFALGADKGGKADQPVAFVGYPNEVAVLQAPPGQHGNFILTDSTRTKASYITVANLTLRGSYGCFGGGGFWQEDESGGTHVRLVGNRFSADYTGNTMTGLVTASGDGWRIYGNDFSDTGTSPPIKNNHAVYVITGADDVDIGWNRFHHLRMGHVIMVHTDVPFVYENIRIHDNLLTADDARDTRGIVVGRALSGSYGEIYNNVLHNIGQDFSAIAIYAGDWKIYNNTLYQIRAKDGMVWLSSQYGTIPSATVSNNIFYSDGNSPYLMLHRVDGSQLRVSNNLYFNFIGPSAANLDKHGIHADPKFVAARTANFRLRRTSPAIDKAVAGTSKNGSRDLDGTRRPQGKAVDIGAYEGPAKQ